MVSVIIPNYNHAKYLKQRIDSVLNQTYRDFELIILDDCSTDNSKAIINAYRSNEKISHIIYNDINSGSTFKQWQKGISIAKGQYIWIAESDDIAERNFLELMILPFLKYETLGIAFCGSYKIDKDNQVTEVRSQQLNNNDSYQWNSDFFEEGKTFIKNAMVFQNPIINASAVLFRKALFDENDLINTTMTLNGDWLCYIKSLLVSDIYYLKSCLNYFRIHSNNGSSANIKNFNNVKEYYYILNFLFSKMPIPASIRRLAKKNAFNLWYYQAGGDFKVVLENQFSTIFRNALLIDQFILLKFIKVKMMRVLTSIKQK